ncbi:hypothetical protein T265_03481 [Opisthorchis viverrini]|uniref:Uncharacterized protein n=1 Tax=Opisthorchis viverrini TaxID=6198 RepID=A0A075AHJ6_OPIVI|nr:hypothetical protein T265_03481 [Opisthorchis viverrini]KER29999.1 hypothetical protein T265_03481 [Opisthorchis viverrini]
MKSFSCNTLSVPNCHATRRKHEDWDTARLPKPRQSTNRVINPHARASTRAGIRPGCPSLDRESREAEVGFEPRTFRSSNLRSYHSSVAHSSRLEKINLQKSLFVAISPIWVQVEYKVDGNSGTALRLPDDPQEGQNRSWTVKEFSTTLTLDCRKVGKCAKLKIHSFANQFGFARDSPGAQLKLLFVMFPGN